MPPEAEITLIKLSGPLTCNNIHETRTRVDTALFAQDVTVDFSGLTQIDSTVLAAIFAWQRTAHACGHSLTLSHLPSSLGSLATVYGVDSLLPGLKI
jgi:phospholipid transport system transporter-binding protein